MSDVRNPLHAPHAIKVLLVDDQEMVGEAVRRMLAGEGDIEFRHCTDPVRALETAAEFAPTVILQDLVMPEVDGLTLVRFYRAHPATQRVPLIVLSTKEEPATKADAFADGANDYLVKLPDRLELLARIRYHSQGYISRVERDEALRLIEAELHEAAEYVRSLLPPPLTGSVRADWRFLPSSDLGGDAFGYHWMDDNHFCMFLLDVCGHGVGAALLSSSVVNVLRTQALPETDFRDPAAVLAGLNEAFPMEEQNEKFFTIWYGVYDRRTRALRCAAGGHPPALLFVPGEAARLVGARGMVIGAMPGVRYPAETVSVPEGAVLLMYSDGVYEITGSDGVVWTWEAWAAGMARVVGEADGLDTAVAEARAVGDGREFEDDYSLVRFRF